MMSPFDCIKEILVGKKCLIVDDITEKEYLPFLVNRGLSFYKDCIMQANEMNRRPLLDKKMQLDFLLNTVRSHKRSFVKWAKPEKNEDIEVVKSFYGYSTSKARDALRILDKKQINEIRESTNIGGLMRK